MRKTMCVTNFPIKSSPSFLLYPMPQDVRSRKMPDELRDLNQFLLPGFKGGNARTHALACAPAVEKRNVPGITANKIIVDTMGCTMPEQGCRREKATLSRSRRVSYPALNWLCLRGMDNCVLTFRTPEYLLPFVALDLGHADIRARSVRLPRLPGLPRRVLSAAQKSQPWFSYKSIGDCVGMDANLVAKVLSKARHIAEDTVPRFVDFVDFRSGRPFTLTPWSASPSEEDVEAKEWFEKCCPFSSLSAPARWTVLCIL